MTYNRTYGRSPTFNFKNDTTIAPSALYLLDIESVSNTARKYLPFNYLRIINQSGVDVELYLNQNADDIFLIPNGTIQVIDKVSAPAIRSFALKNIDTSTTISANTIRVEVFKEDVGIDDVANKMFRFFKGGTKNKGVV